MKRYILLVICMLLIGPLWAAETYPGLQLASAPIHPGDIDAIKRGAKFFATNCMSCHTMVYLRYDKIAQEAGITYDKMPLNVTNWPYGVKPPDLSLEADVRGPDWIYTYLHSFYVDPSRPTGLNNLLVPQTAMPGIVTPYQGTQELVKNPMPDWLGHVRWYDLVKLTKQGTMTPEEFDATMADLVTFLMYAAEPYHTEQRHIGWWVLGFLVLFLVMIYKLKVEYWRDVKRHKHK